MPYLVGTQYLKSAVSLNSTNFNITRMLGPILAAFLLSYLSYSTISFECTLSYPYYHCLLAYKSG